MTTTNPERIDHLVFAAPDFEEAVSSVEALMGMRPVAGGRHPDFGTRNALLSLGASTYLEILAPDPTLPRPQRGRLTEAWGVTYPRLATWVYSAGSEIDAAAARCRVPLGTVRPCSRLTPDGGLLSWRLTDPYEDRLGGTVPFLIDWMDSRHPATSAPQGGTLLSLHIAHPAPDAVMSALGDLGHPGEVRPAESATLVARIQTAYGIVELR